ncbi:hypothetical protein LOAG_10205 [Loa loa]|uniref:Uncharacterized protein n=1 Tax=Loa loa TaxID=7209 RepID=A0A1S0TRK2_LOALO|nr:hypothetical protein LOAG_10205 [Loa loa]EFO18288.2 hypothetical protein LOAG_10205 [Loa loa]
METVFQTLTIEDGILAIKHVCESTITPHTAISPLRNLRHLLNGITAHSVTSLEEDMGDFLLEDNYFEDNWVHQSSALSWNSPHPEKTIPSTSNFPQTISDQLTPVNSSMSLPSNSRMYRLCWISDSEQDSISADANFSLNHFSSTMDSAYAGYGTGTCFADELNPHNNSEAFI